MEAMSFLMFVLLSVFPLELLTVIAVGLPFWAAIFLLMYGVIWKP